MALHVERLGAPPPGGELPRLALLHGFTQNAACWGPFGRALGRHFEVVAADLPGHGRSGHDEADLWEAGRLVADAVGPAIHVGYSMGGRVALHAALGRPRAVTGLVLIGATAGIDDEAERARRRDADEALARRLSADGLPAFLDRWLANPLFAGLDPEQACRAERLTNRAEGLAASLVACGTGTQEPLWDRLGALDIPVLVVVGERDHKFRALGERLVAALPPAAGARLVTIPGTHAVHLEQPGPTAAAIIEAFHPAPGR